jgi:hypothetical protein
MSLTTTSVCQPTGPGRRRPIVAKRWQGEVVARVVHEALASRDVEDPESVTEAMVALLVGVETLLERSLGAYERKRFRHLAATGRPSAIIRLVHRLNGRIRDRLARELATRSDVSALIWG